MKAIKVIEPFKVEIVDVPNPTIKKDDDVIVRITPGGICGSDIGIWRYRYRSWFCCYFCKTW